MDLLQKYDELSNSNNLSIVGIDLVNETAQQWDLLNRDCFKNCNIRLMAWMSNNNWNPILDHGTLFMGIVNMPSIYSVSYRFTGSIIEYPGILYMGYWRLFNFPIPLDSISPLEVCIKTSDTKFELAWLIINNIDHQKMFASMNDEIQQQIDEHKINLE